MNDLVKQAQKVVDAVQRDDCGQMVGQIWQGGNGGLLSNATLLEVDKLRKLLLAADRAPAHAPNAQHASHLEPDTAFERWRDSLPATHWSKYDLSACRLGWDAANAAHAQRFDAASLFRAAQAYISRLPDGTLVTDDGMIAALDAALTGATA